jgi:hypothetical protein
MDSTPEGGAASTGASWERRPTTGFLAAGGAVPASALRLPFDGAGGAIAAGASDPAGGFAVGCGATGCGTVGCTGESGPLPLLSPRPSRAEVFDGDEGDSLMRLAKLTVALLPHDGESVVCSSGRGEEDCGSITSDTRWLPGWM